MKLSGFSMRKVIETYFKSGETVLYKLVITYESGKKEAFDISLEEMKNLQSLLSRYIEKEKGGEA